MFTSLLWIKDINNVIYKEILEFINKIFGNVFDVQKELSSQNSIEPRA